MIKSHIIALSLCTAILKSIIFLLFILNTLLHARQRTGKYVIPQDANAPILLKGPSIIDITLKGGLPNA